jgi:hypothetical protein
MKLLYKKNIKYLDKNKILYAIITKTLYDSLGMIKCMGK